jgi:PAS domain S-box-containing protein
LLLLFGLLWGTLRAETATLGTAQRPVIVGINRDYPPYEFVNARGEAEGYDVDLVRAVARVMGLEIRILPGPWEEVRKGLEQGRIDLAPGMLKSPERARFADFSAPHMVVHYSIFVRRDATALKSLEELRGHRILVERGSQMHEHLLGQGFGASIVPVASEPEALRLLAAGLQDAALAPHLEGALQIQNTGLWNLRTVGGPVFSRELCFAVVKGQDDLRAKLDAGLAILHRTGEYEQIYRKWFGSVEPKPLSPWQILRTSLWIVVPLLVGSLGILLWNWLLRRKVHQATLQLRSANQALRESEGLLKAVIDSIPLMLFVKDPQQDFRFTVWNSKTEELLGIPREEMLGKTDYELLPADQVEVFRKADQAVLDSGCMLDIPEETVLSPVKGPVLLHTIKVPVPDDEGRPRFLLGISEDLTLFKRIEAELRRSQASLAEAQRMARMGSWELDPASGEVFWSDEMFRILGHEPRQCQPSLDALLRQSHPKDTERLREAFRQISTEEAPITLDHRILLPNGSERHLLSHIEAQTDNEGRRVRLLGTSQDITERRNSEDALRQTQRLESLGVLAGGIAHDFNNLLTAILGNLNLAQNLAGEDHPAHPYLGKIETTVLRASSLARQMLAYSGRGTFIIKPLDLNRLIKEMTHLLEVSLSKKVVIHFALDPFIPPIDADEGQIQQVVMNLVTNASEAIGDQEGMITLTTRLQAIDEEMLALHFHGQGMREGTYVAFEVKDTGCGMGSEVMARLFEPFFTTKFSGRGLGLAALRGIIQAHGGGILIESEPDKGSTFRLFFPASAEASAPTLEDRDHSGEPGRGTILIAEDEPTIRLSTAEMLQSLGYKVLEASDGVFAMECFQAHAEEISAVLLDLTMPRMDGREVLREILKLRPNTKVILCSGYHKQEALQGTEAQTIAGFLPKPYRLRELQAILQKVLGG